MKKPKKKVNLPPTTYVKKGSRPSVAPQQFTSTFDGISRNPVSPPVSSFTPSVEPPKRNQNVISHDSVTHRPLNGGTTRFRIPSYPRKRATPKPAFGRFVPPTGGSMKFYNTSLINILLSLPLLYRFYQLGYFNFRWSEHLASLVDCIWQHLSKRVSFQSFSWRCICWTSRYQSNKLNMKY